MKKLLSLLIVLFLPTLIYSQSYIQIKSELGISVFLDDEFKGITSLEFGGLIIENVNVGSHTLKFVKEGFSPQTERVSVKSGEVFSYQVRNFIPKIKISQKGNTDNNSIELSTGNFKIQSLTVSISISIPKLGINSKKVEDEWLGEELPIGEYNSTFTWNGKKLNKYFVIDKNKRTHLFVNFIKKEKEKKKLSKMFLLQLLKMF